jgi:hypothetical protein
VDGENDLVNGMGNDAKQPGATPTVEKTPDGAVRAGSPGRPSDTVHMSKQPPPKAKKVEKAPEPPKDPFREIVETVVFVIVLVFMLKTFLAEAFVIPTGSMATTLLGYHKDVTCKQCGYQYRVNASTEAEPPFQPRIETSQCPNCQFINRVGGPFAGAGD